jgi:hypothetical protein
MTDASQALKLIELSICSNPEADTSEPPNEHENITSGGVDVLPDQELWYPDIPPPGLRWIAMKKARPDHKPYQACIFGGDRGQDLHFLSGVTIGYMSGIRSIEFSFNPHADSNQSMAVLQHRDERISSSAYVEFSMEIDGEGGERIVGIESLRHKTLDIAQGISGLRVGSASRSSSMANMHDPGLHE